MPPGPAANGTAHWLTGRYIDLPHWEYPNDWLQATPRRRNQYVTSAGTSDKRTANSISVQEAGTPLQTTFEKAGGRPPAVTRIVNPVYDWTQQKPGCWTQGLLPDSTLTALAGPAPHPRRNAHYIYHYGRHGRGWRREDRYNIQEEECPTVDHVADFLFRQQRCWYVLRRCSTAATHR